MLRTFAMWWSL